MTVSESVAKYITAQSILDAALDCLATQRFELGKAMIETFQLGTTGVTFDYYVGSHTIRMENRNGTWEVADVVRTPASRHRPMTA